MIHLNIVHNEEIDNWIAERHYLHTAPAGAVIRMEFVDDEKGRIGAMMWGRNPSPKVQHAEQLCLTRMYFIDDTEHCVESKCLGWGWHKEFVALDGFANTKIEVIGNFR